MEGPVFIRVSRMPVPELARPADAEFRLGRAEVLREGGDAVVIANGVMVSRALAAAEALAAAGLSARVVNMSSIAPLDLEAIHAAAEVGAIVTVEEHSVRGGLGGAVAEVVAAIARRRCACSASRASCRPARPNISSRGTD